MIFEEKRLNSEKLQGEILSDKLIKYWEKNIALGLVQYDFKYPYNIEIYKIIANTYIGVERKVITRKVNKTIKIDYINNLSWHELQLLRGGCDKFTSMVNLYNQFACKNNIKQIVNIDLLKKRIDILNEQEYYREAKYIESFLIKYSNNNLEQLNKFSKMKNKDISKEVTIDCHLNEVDKSYYRELSNIENITFDKIFRYCKNLSTNSNYDRRHQFFVEFAKIYKALIYDAMDKIKDEIINQSLTLIDWGCKQGIGTLLVLDYIREKQLSIDINQVILIEDNSKLLSRSVTHTKALNSEVEIDMINFKDNATSNIQKIKNNITLNLIVNDTFPIDYVNFEEFATKESIFIGISHKNEFFIKKLHTYLTSEFKLIKNISSRDNKIGKYIRYEKIFSIKGKGEK